MAGPPPISPFEPQTTKPEDEDKELQDYIASFKYTPPAETADELTMRSEVPEIDEAEPEPFHHPSFDNDEAPPPEAGPHPTGDEFYKDGHSIDRTHFLEVAETKADETGGAYPAILAAETVGPTKGRRWPWIGLAVLVAIFAALGFWEGRAENAPGMRGPMEVAHHAYQAALLKWNEWMKPAAVQAPAPETAKPANDTPQEKPGEKPAASANEPAASNKAPAQTPAQTEEKPAAPVQSASTEPSKPASNEPAAQTAATTIQAPPPPNAAIKSQPGQAEFDKALAASDATAAAAWLWKSTSRGNPEAPVRLADMYIKGTGVPRSCEQAMVLLRSAAAKENASARNRLAALYANGTCVARDRVKAYQLMSSALEADPNSEWAKENRDVLLRQMTPQERSEAQKLH